VAYAFVSVLTAVAVPAASQAQGGLDFSGSVTLGYSRASIGGIPGLSASLSGASLNFASDLRFEGGLSVGLDFGLSQRALDVSGLGNLADLDLTSLSLEPSYRFGNGAYVGLYYRMGDLDISPIGLPITLGVDARAYGLFGGYESGPLWVEGFVGRSNTDPGLPGGFRVRDYGIAGSYDVNPQLEVFGSVMRTGIDVLGLGVSMTSVSVGADYDFGNNLSAYGSIGRLGMDLNVLGSYSATGLTLGAAYEVSAMGTPMVLSAEFSRTNLSLGPVIPVDPNINRFSLGLTIPLGNNGATTPLNSNTRAARGDYRSVIAALVGAF
jgi:hypothetical protein